MTLFKGKNVLVHSVTVHTKKHKHVKMTYFYLLLSSIFFFLLQSSSIFFFLQSDRLHDCPLYCAFSVHLTGSCGDLCRPICYSVFILSSHHMTVYYLNWASRILSVIYVKPSVFLVTSFLILQVRLHVSTTAFSSLFSPATLPLSSSLSRPLFHILSSPGFTVIVYILAFR